MLGLMTYFPKETPFGGQVRGVQIGKEMWGSSCQNNTHKT